MAWALNQAEIDKVKATVKPERPEIEMASIGLFKRYRCMACKVGVYYQMSLCLTCQALRDAEELASRIKHSPACHVEGCIAKPTIRKTVAGRNGYLCEAHSHLGHDSQEA